MHFLIDTNVFSEPTKLRPSRAVRKWVGSQRGDALAVSTVSLGEVRRGIDLLDHGTRRDTLERWLKRAVQDQFHGRILAVTKQVALAWGRLAAEGQKRGRPLEIADGLLLATAAVHRLTIVTRNERDFEDRGVPVINPWRGRND